MTAADDRRRARIAALVAAAPPLPEPAADLLRNLAVKAVTHAE